MVSPRPTYRAPWTAKLAALAQQETKMPTVRLSGPYGHTDFTSYETLMLFAGGIGITPMIAIFAHLRKCVGLGHGLGCLKRVVLVWNSRSVAEFRLFEEVFAIVAADHDRAFQRGTAVDSITERTIKSAARHQASHGPQSPAHMTTKARRKQRDSPAAINLHSRQHTQGESATVPQTATSPALSAIPSASSGASLSTAADAGGWVSQFQFPPVAEVDSLHAPAGHLSESRTPVSGLLSAPPTFGSHSGRRGPLGSEEDTPLRSPLLMGETEVLGRRPKADNFPNTPGHDHVTTLPGTDGSAAFNGMRGALESEEKPEINALNVDGDGDGACSFDIRLHCTRRESWVSLTSASSPDFVQMFIASGRCNVGEVVNSYARGSRSMVAVCGPVPLMMDASACAAAANCDFHSEQFDF